MSSESLSVEEARQQMLQAVKPCAPIKVMLSNARGLVLAESIEAPSDLPRFADSAMDGYALRWEDVSSVSSGRPLTLPVAFEIPAGKASPIPLMPGHAARIMTGAPMPEGADTVIPREDTREEGELVTLLQLPKRGRFAYVRRQGEYAEKGTLLVRAGQLVDAGLIGFLASIGRSVIRVHRPPRVAIVSTGDELVDLGETPGPGQIFNSSAYMLSALVESDGGLPMVTERALDQQAHCRERFEEAISSADLVISTAGVSVGDYDVVRAVLDDLQADLQFWRLRMRPGKPLAFGVVDGTPMIGLPGNPVSSFVSYQQFVRVLIRRARGLLDGGDLPRLRAVLGEALEGDPSRRDYVRGRLQQGPDEIRFIPYPHQGSGNLISLLEVDGLGIVPESVGFLDKGAPIVVELLFRNT